MRPKPPRRASEPAWHTQLTVLVAIVLGVLTDGRLTIRPHWLIPALEGVLLAMMMVVTPRQLTKSHRARRYVAVTLTGLVSAANIYALVELVSLLLERHAPEGRDLIISGALIWLTNVLIFGLWYWEFDRGGPGQRLEGTEEPPDFLFPQMSGNPVQAPDWRPSFIDYLYVSLTNATAFSPTDTMPLSHLAKGLMGLQSLVSLLTLGLVIARAVNIL